MKSNQKESLPENEAEHEVLVATDRARDAAVLSAVLGRESVATTVVSDGRSVLTHLIAADDSENRDVDLIVLDLSLPGVDGRTVLDAIRSSPRRQSLPIVAIVDEDTETTAAVGPNGTLRRREDEQAFVRAVESMARFWLECATFPPEKLNPADPSSRHD